MASEPISSTVKAVELGLRLRARRDQLGLTAAAVGRITGIGGNNLSSIEIAKRRLTSTKLTELAGIYELSGDELAELDALRVQADRREWWDDYARLYSDDFLRFIGLEAGATVQQEYAAETIPGLLQTADYARAMILGGSPYIKPVDVGPRVESRLARQSILTKNNPPKVDLILDETALRRVVGNRKIMARQLRALLEFAELPNLRLWIVPFDRGGSIGFDYPFYLMDFQHGNSVVFLENTASGLFIEDKEEIDYFQYHAGRLGRAALNPDESAGFVARLAKEHERE